MATYIKIEAYHGTDLNNKEGIIENNFDLSYGDQDWLGDGVYFFVEGWSTPIEAAKKWVVSRSWDNDLKKYNKYLSFCILKTDIEIEDKFLLDLTTDEGKILFNLIRDQFIEKIKEAGKRMSHKFKDGYVINAARKFGMNIEAVKGDFYIRTTDENAYNINFRIPNHTILAVSNIDCINKKSITEVKKGEIADEVR